MYPGGRIFFPLLLTAYFSGQIALGVGPVGEDTTNPGTSGYIIVKAVVLQIAESKIFSDDYDILLFIAEFESNYGEDKQTYRDGFYGGIWQIGEDAFKDTQDLASHPELKVKILQINDELGIDWTAAIWKDLYKPLYSGIAMRLILFLSPDPIPEDSKGQTVYYEKLKSDGIFGSTRDDDDTIVEGDPHVAQRVTGSERLFSYEVFGDSGDIYRFLQEPYLDLKVNAKLISGTRIRQRKVAKYVGELVIITNQLSIHIDIDGATVKDQFFSWTTYTDRHLMDDNSLHFTIDKDGMVIKFSSLVRIKVIKEVKHDTFLDFAIHSGQISSEAKGLIADIEKSVTILEHGKSADLILWNPDGSTSTTELKKGNNYWKLSYDSAVNFPGFMELLLRNKIDCLSC